MALRMISVLVIIVSVGSNRSGTTSWAAATPSNPSRSADANDNPCLSPDQSDILLGLHALNELSAGCVNQSCLPTAARLTEDELNREFALFVRDLGTGCSATRTIEPDRSAKVTVSSRSLIDVISEEYVTTIPPHSSTDLHDLNLTTTSATHPDTPKTNDVTTRGSTVAPPSGEGMEQASMAEMFDLAGQSRSAGATDVQQRSLCPWKHVVNIDPNRRPVILIEAECLYEECGHELRLGSGVGCEKVYNNIPVIRRVQSDQCPEKTKWKFERSFQRLAVACTCSVMHSV